MFFVNLYKKVNQIKRFAANSTAFHQQNQLVRGTTLLRYLKNQSFGSFCSLANVDLSENLVENNTCSLANVELSEDLAKKKAFTVSYLIKSCGLSPKRATSVSSRLILKDSETPNSVLALFESYGFSKSQIESVVNVKPVLNYTQKFLLPKLEFFKSIGMSKSLLVDFIVREPNWLERSLEKFIVLNYDFLKSVLLTDEKVSKAFYNLALYLGVHALENVAPNIETLSELKVPDSCIRYLLSTYPETLQLRTKDFEESVSEVLGMGFDPLKISFVVSLHVVSGSNNKAIFARCSEMYSNWGWSREDISMAFSI